MKLNKSIIFTAFAVMTALLSLAVSSFAQQTAVPSETTNTTVAKASSDEGKVPSVNKVTASSTTKTDAKPAASPTDDTWDYKSSDDWHWEIRPYFWGAGMNGTLRARNTGVPVKADFSKILGNVDIALAAQFEAGKGNWRVIVDENYVNLGIQVLGSNGIPVFHVEPTINIFEGGVAYRMVAQPHRGANADTLPPKFSAELLGGVRWMNLNTTVRNAADVEVEGSTDLIGFFIGNRYKFNVAGPLTLVGKWTVGTSGVGSNVTATADGYADLRLADHFSVTGGYRFMNINADDFDNTTGFRGQLKGWLAGFVIHN